MKITIGNTKLKLYRKSGENDPRSNERTVELPLGFYFLEKFRTPALVELGAVMPYYKTDCKHDVYDLHDPYEHCKRVDFSNMQSDFSGRDVLSISTIEHIGYNDYSKAHGFFPIERWGEGLPIIEKVVKTANNYLLTIPLGINPVLDTGIEKAKYPAIILKRTSRWNRWVLDEAKNFNYLYGKPQGDYVAKFMNGKVKENGIKAQYNNANAVCIITNLAELHP